MRLHPVVAALSCLASCAPAPAAPQPPTPPTSAPLPQPEHQPEYSGPPTLLLQGERVEVLGQPVQSVRDPISLPKQPTPAAPTPFQLKLTPMTPSEQLMALLQSSARAGWPVAELQGSEPSIRVELASQGSAPPSDALATLLMWPQLLHAGKLTEPTDSRPIDGLLATSFPYENNVGATVGCLRHTCDLVRAQLAPLTPLGEFTQALSRVAQANRGSVLVLLIEGSMRVPGHPSARAGHTNVSGRLPPEVIQRVVRAAYPKFRACYEDGLRRDPTLEGKVTTRFVIGRNGEVSNTAIDDANTTLPDKRVLGCVIREFYALKFPPHEGGLVTVVYPVAFSPED